MRHDGRNVLFLFAVCSLYAYCRYFQRRLFCIESSSFGIDFFFADAVEQKLSDKRYFLYCSIISRTVAFPHLVKLHYSCRTKVRLYQNTICTIYIIVWRCGEHILQIGTHIAFLGRRKVTCHFHTNDYIGVIGFQHVLCRKIVVHSSVKHNLSVKLYWGKDKRKSHWGSDRKPEVSRCSHTLFIILNVGSYTEKRNHQTIKVSVTSSGCRGEYF